MRELNVVEVKEVSGGVASLVIWAVRGGMYLYRTYSATQIGFGIGFVGGTGITVAAELDD